MTQLPQSPPCLTEGETSLLDLMQQKLDAYRHPGPCPVANQGDEGEPQQSHRAYQLDQLDQLECFTRLVRAMRSQSA